ncbi:glycerophosphodiester phosphodiesterase [Legionella worsleiensis]|uniref:Glycerophosphoryl diester phosphodiesterase n=1 Tax=Legionella worsleiensis TaxID=45076 RepID=A0A0W1AEG2_9GAMM|nr:glycerophosphodiester phosphodiesterase family protein [Legionella worsleiensis]KTD79713.1 glycerophosphoryl diester phosphodiesterase [Legionella worsleiensis]STY32224.1 glycerophosphoryl diester phosphodiesterase [Legionella worsleiensis]
MLLALAEQIIDSFFAVIPRHKPELINRNHAKIIAHRGAHANSQGIIENTMAAFDLAQNAGCWGIELDVQTTADGVLVVNHDATLQRLWGHDKAIKDLTFSDLRSLVPDIPALTEVISKYRNQMHLFIELKSALKDESALMTCLQGLSPVKDFHLLSLDACIFDALTLFPKKSLLLVAGHNNTNAFCELSIKNTFGGVLGSYLLLTEQQINKLKNAEQAFGVGFVNSKNSLYRELNRGIDWIFTNNAVKVSHYLRHLYS